MPSRNPQNRISPVEQIGPVAKPDPWNGENHGPRPTIEAATYPRFGDPKICR